jgi:hypothetical protein
MPTKLTPIYDKHGRLICYVDEHDVCARWERRVEQLKTALRQIKHVIGPTVPEATRAGAAEGRPAEIAEALSIIDGVLKSEETKQPEGVRYEPQ